MWRRNGIGQRQVGVLSGGKDLLKEAQGNNAGHFNDTSPARSSSPDSIGISLAFLCWFGDNQNMAPDWRWLSMEL